MGPRTHRLGPNPGLEGLRDSECGQSSRGDEGSTTLIEGGSRRRNGTKSPISFVTEGRRRRRRRGKATGGGQERVPFQSDPPPTLSS